MTSVPRNSLDSMVALLALASFAPVALSQPPAPPSQNGGQNPDNDQFDQLLEAEKRYRAIADAGGWPALPDGDPMKPGERHDCARLEALAKRLAVEGYRSGTVQAASAGSAAEGTPPAADAARAPQAKENAPAPRSSPARGSAANAPGSDTPPAQA